MYVDIIFNGNFYILHFNLYRIYPNILKTFIEFSRKRLYIIPLFANRQFFRSYKKHIELRIGEIHNE